MMRSKMILLCLTLVAILWHHSVGVVEGQGQGSSNGNFDVKRFGATGNGKTDDTKAFKAAWKAACNSVGNVKLSVPQGTYLIGSVTFMGPCKQASSITVNLKGTLKATTNLGAYGDAWVEFRVVDGLKLNGGTFDGQGSTAWPHNTCPKNWNCKLLPTSIKFTTMTNTVVRGITSLNSKFFHIALVGCRNFKGSGIKISAPADSPNTDGIHVDQSTDVTIQQASIATGDDCISIGQGNSRVLVSGVRCGPGHGISVGSLGKYSYEKDVRGLIVRDSTISGTANGIRIKTWANSPGRTVVSNMTFENIVMNNVANPIIIDQAYCPYASCPNAVPSRVKISDIFFKNIRGTTSTPTAVILNCSRGIPCSNVRLHNVHLDHPGGIHATAQCTNVNAIYSGTQIPPPCA